MARLVDVGILSRVQRELEPLFDVVWHHGAEENAPVMLAEHLPAPAPLTAVPHDVDAHDGKETAVVEALQAVKRINFLRHVGHPGTILAVAAELAHVVPLLVKTLPLVPGATI